MRRLVIAFALASLAGAAGTTTAPAAVTHGLFRSVPGVTQAFEKSGNWSGVALTGGTYTRVTGSWTVPTAKATSGSRYAATWVGIGGFTTGSEDLIQAGTAEEYAGGHANYYAWTETLPAPESKVSLAIHPGDSVTVDVDQVSAGSWTIKISDASTGKSSTTNINYASQHSSAEWIHEAPTVNGSQSRLASTNAVHFDHGTVNGSTVIGSGGTEHFIQLIGKTDATPSKLDSDKDGIAVADGSSAPSPPAS